MGNKVSNIEDKRVVEIGKPNYAFPDNKLTSSKYTLWNFLPKNLFKQFRRLANFYFLIMSVITCVIDSPVSPWASFTPMVIVVSVSAVKQAYEDWLRHRADRITNAIPVIILQNGIEKIKTSKDIKVGDIVKIPNDSDVPCDLVILNSSRQDSKCFVTTSNLDGETNLKMLECPLQNYFTTNGMEHINGKIECELPTADLYCFNGALDLAIDHEDALAKTFPANVDSDREPDSEECFNTVYFKTLLTASNLLLRGSRLKNTDFALGCAVYTGHDTKLAHNSRKTSQKSARSERGINYYLFFFFCLLVLEVLISLVMDCYEDSGEGRPYLGYYSGLTLTHVLNEFFSYIVLYYYIIPISLYVTIEFQRFLGAWYFNWDLEMMYNDQHSSANTSDINEDLGQIEYLFTDKTGTLTRNEMTFREFSTWGNRYSLIDREIMEETEEGSLPITEYPREVEMLLLGMALCHTVQCCDNLETNIHQLALGYLPKYEATSPDEKALVEAGARCGAVYLGEESGIITVQFKDKLMTFKKCRVIEFTSDRKRMSILVTQEDGKMVQFCKGAESGIVPILTSGMIEEELENAKHFSQKGLRTLMFGWRVLEGEALKTISKPEISEEGLTLIGVTAVEDELQLDVAKTLTSLRNAGIKIWILTGDRAETALTVATACGHVTSSTLLLKLIEQHDVVACIETLKQLRTQINEDYSLIMDGRSFKLAVGDPDCVAILLEIALKSRSVLCCRLAPKQKSQIVHLVKETPTQPMTAAIGDGANDVAMILEAHVGLGLLGKEGRQAANNADFVLPLFCALQRALLLHGHWYYHRIAYLIQYFFYKNIVFVTPQVFFAIHNGVSPQPLFSNIFFLLYNTAFTALPILFYALLEQDYTASALISEPKLYGEVRRNALLSWRMFFGWLASGIWHSVVVYFVPWLLLMFNPILLLSSQPIDLTTFGTIVFHCSILVVNLKLMLLSHYWTIPFIASIVVSVAGFIIFTFLYSVLNIPLDPLYGVYTKLMESPSFWFLTLLVVTISLIPDYSSSAFINTVCKSAFNSYRDVLGRKKGLYKVQKVRII